MSDAPDGPGGWAWDKNIDDFECIAVSLFKERQISRAQAIMYLIERVKRAEAKTPAEIEEPPCPKCGASMKEYITRYKCRRCHFEAKKPYPVEGTPSIDDLLLQEVYSLREKLKITAWGMKKFDPDFDVQLFLHQVSSVDYDQLMEEFEEETSATFFEDLRKIRSYIMGYPRKSITDKNAQKEALEAVSNLFARKITPLEEK